MNKAPDTTPKNLLKTLEPTNFLFLLVAGIVNAFGVTLFLFPVKLYDSGISGLSMLLDRVTPDFLSLSVFLVVINTPIFLFGLKKQGFAFTVYSLFAVAVYAGASFLITDVLPIDVSFVSPLAEQDLFLCAVFGGLISGVGSGLTIRFGGAIDGIDVLSVTFAKKLGLSIGSFVLAYNVLLYIVCGFVMHSWVLPLYSIVTFFIGSKTIDYMVEGFDRSICALIITDHASDVTKALSENFRNAGTIISAVGGYSKSQKSMVYFVLNHFQVNRLKTVVKGVDPKAYITLQEVSDVVKADV